MTNESISGRLSRLLTPMLTALVISASMAAPPAPVPVISDVVADFVATPNKITINGTGFGSSTPVVQIGGIAPLTVTSSTATQVVATLPSGILPGSYYLTLTTAGKAATTEEFWVTLGAAGPQGDAGLQGIQGPKGEKGDKGDIASLDELIGKPCNSGKGILSISYGGGVGYPVSFSCTPSGPGVTPAVLSLDTLYFSFGPEKIPFPFPVLRDITVTNTGTLWTDSITIEIAGSGSAAFSIVSAGAGTCTGAPLAGATSCTVRVAFSTETVGNYFAILKVSSASGGIASATLQGIAY